MTNFIVEAADVVKRLGSGPTEVEALRGVSLRLHGGQLALLMGPSGSGKTTLLTVLGCMLSPIRGFVKVHGRATERLCTEELAKIRREHVGFIFQSYHLFRERTDRPDHRHHFPPPQTRAAFSTILDTATSNRQSFTPT